MARKKRTYGAPLVVTVVTLLGVGCEEGPDDGGGSGGQDSGESTGGAGGSLTMEECNPALIDSGPFGDNASAVGCSPGTSCRLPLTCTSGIDRELIYVCNEVTLTYRLDSNQEGTACDHPYEGCVASRGITYDCRDDEWRYYGGGGNPPAPCPEEAPPDGTTCRPGGQYLGFGLDRDHCGYACIEDDGWTIVSCAATGDLPEDGEWSHDNACENVSPGGSNGQ